MKTHRRRLRQQYLLFFLIFLGMLFFEEYNYGKINILLKDYYDHAVYFPIDREREGSFSKFNCVKIDFYIWKMF